MADGYPVIVKLNLPPEAQYASGHSVIVQGDSVADVAAKITSINDLEDSVGKSVLLRFLEYGLLGAVKDALAKEKAAEKAEAVADAKTKVAAKKAPAKKAPVKKPAAKAEAKIEGEASPALKAAAANKVGKTVEELGSITTTEAKRLIKEGK